jgi:hypothetical protein
MKIIKITSLFLLLISLNINSQSTLDSYSFGEGISFTADNGSKIKLSGYAQPHVELKNYTDLETNSSYNRFRLRRLRLRFDGQAKNPKFSYRFQIDLSGTSETGDASGDYLLPIEYHFEGIDLQLLKKGTSSAEPITVAVWLKSNLTGNFNMEIWDRQNDRQKNI